LHRSFRKQKCYGLQPTDDMLRCPPSASSVCMDVSGLLEKSAMSTSAEKRENIVSDGSVSVTEAVRFTGMSRAWLYGAMERGELPFIKLGGARRIPRKSLVKLLEDNLVA